MQPIAQTLANKGFEVPAQYTAQYFARNFEEASKRNNHGRFQHCTVLLHSIARYCAGLRISIHLLCKLLYKRAAQLCTLSNRIVEKNDDFNQKRRNFRQRISRRQDPTRNKPPRQKHMCRFHKIFCAIFS